MNAALLRLLAALWKPLAALLGALGLYAKGRADARRQARLKATEARLETIREVRRNEREAETQDDPELVRRLTRKP